MAFKNVIFSLISGSKFFHNKTEDLMKKIALLFLTLLTLWSCGDEVEFSTPGFQAKKNYNLWRANYFTATIDNSNGTDRIIITAGKSNEKITFSLNSGALGVRTLSETSSSTATFDDFDEREYSTANPPDPSVSLYPEIGEVRITESTPEFISGRFYFIAYTENGMNSIGFNDGEFYRIPFTNSSAPSGNVTCQQAIVNSSTAAGAFGELSLGDDGYTAACNAYKTALQQQINACGDPGGSLAAFLASLGDCS